MASYSIAKVCGRSSAFMHSCLMAIFTLHNHTILAPSASWALPTYTTSSYCECVNPCSPSLSPSPLDERTWTIRYPLSPLPQPTTVYPSSSHRRPLSFPWPEFDSSQKWNKHTLSKTSSALLSRTTKTRRGRAWLTSPLRSKSKRAALLIPSSLFFKNKHKCFANSEETMEKS